MFAAFNLHITDDFVNLCHSKRSKELHRISDEIYKNIDYHALSNGSINVASLEEDWFPKIQAKVFLSHSHKDITIVNGIAEYLLQEFGITSFIDSDVWGYVDQLITKLNEKYCIGIDDSDWC